MLTFIILKVTCSFGKEPKPGLQGSRATNRVAAFQGAVKLATLKQVTSLETTATLFA